MTCEHKRFIANVAIGRLSEKEGGPVTHYTADVKVQCADCGVNLEFVGMPVGTSAYRPCSSLGGDEARLPMVIPGTKVPKGLVSAMLSHAEMPEGMN